jgi:hypothetical protein
MKTNDKIDAARIDLLLGELRLSGVRLIWATLAATADKEGWPAARFLAALAEQRWSSEADAASSGISRKRGCLLEKPSTRSTSTLCR